jgi:hypothetical protein
VKVYLAITDNQWFSYLSRLHPDEINFWQPGGSQAFSALEPARRFFLNSIALRILSLAAVFSSVIPFYQSLLLGTPSAKRTVLRTFQHSKRKL